MTSARLAVDCFLLGSGSGWPFNEFAFLWRISWLAGGEGGTTRAELMQWCPLLSSSTTYINYSYSKAPRPKASAQMPWSSLLAGFSCIWGEYCAEEALILLTAVTLSPAPCLSQAAQETWGREATWSEDSGLGLAKQALTMAEHSEQTKGMAGKSS